MNEIRKKVLKDLSLDLTEFESRLSRILDNEREEFQRAVRGLDEVQALEESVAAQNMAGYINILEKWHGLLVDVVLEMGDDRAEYETTQPVAKRAAIKTLAPEDALLDTRAAAEFLGVSKSALTKWRWLGGGPRFVKLGRRVCYEPEALLLFIKQRSRANTAGEE